MSDSDSRSILVIDSGVGGLSVSQSILNADPTVRIIYLADDAYFPYGLMPEGQLLARLKELVGIMVERHHPKLVVLACNTVSTLVLPELRAQYDVPFVGVVPAIKPAAQLSTSKRIGLLATPATVKRSYTDDLISDFASDCKVIRIGSNDLVLQAENLLAGRAVCRDIVFEAIKPLLTSYDSEPVDTVVLGCTHFPLLNEVLTSLMPSVKLVDSGEAIARRVLSLLDASSEAIIEQSQLSAMKEHLVYFSKALPEREQFSSAMEKLGFNQIKLVKLEV